MARQPTSHRILLIAAAGAVRDELRRILMAGSEGLAGESRVEWPTLGDLQIDVAAGLKEGLDLMRHEASGAPYALAVIDAPDCDLAESVAGIRRLREFNQALPLAVIAAAEVRSQWIAALAPMERAAMLARPIHDFDMRQLAAALIDAHGAHRAAADMQRQLAATRQEVEERRKEAEEANHVKSHFMANVSHEIRTPLNAILGFSRLLMREPLAPHQLEKLRYVHDAGSTLLAIVDDVLDFSRLAAGKFVLRPVRFSLEEVFREIDAAIRSSAESKGIDLLLRVDPAVPVSLEGDVLQLRQILLKLVDNAIKFTERGSVQVRAVLEEQSADEARVRLSVTDTGVGIPADRQLVIFEAFRQADGSNTRRYGGLGLGLTIVKELTDLMRGQVGFTSAAEQGSSFWVAVPLKRVSNPDSEPVRSLPAAPEVEGTGDVNQGATGPRILVAEDDRLNRTLLEAVLVKLGCTVDLVENGSDALAAARRGRYDLIFMDVQMPKMDGLTAIQRIRRREHGGARVPIVVLTAMVRSEDRQRCLSAGADEFVTKPFTAEFIARVLRRHVLSWSRFGQDRQRAGAAERDSESTAVRLRQALRRGAFPIVESLAGESRQRALRLQMREAADHAMRVQMAARARDPRRAAAAIDKLDFALRSAAAEWRCPDATVHSSRVAVLEEVAEP